MTVRIDSLHGYYKTQPVLPTFAALADEKALRAYQSQRERVFLENLKMPPRAFRGARVVEFGPDSGENALVFARWGARLTLVEPNPRAWGKIHAYFRKFKLAGQVDRLAKSSLERFKSRERFDFVVAEGFIYTVRPARVWIDLFKRLLKPGGFVVLSHMESSGMLFDLLWRAAHARMKALTGLAPVEAAGRLFGEKWKTVGHTRPFGSWVMDNLENPFVRLKYCYPAPWLYARMEEAGLPLFSSWPAYQDALSMSWHKRPVSRAERLGRDLDFLARSRLSFALGRKAFLRTDAPGAVLEANRRVERLVSSVDGLIDAFDRTAALGAVRDARALGNLLRRGAAFCAEPMSAVPAGKVLEGLAALLEAMARGDAERMAAVCGDARSLLRTWGLPYHLAVFRAEK